MHSYAADGGVLLAILILALALIPPDGSRAPFPSANIPARGALVDRDRHPEMRQFLIHAALKRADELSRLRDLPDTPARSDDKESKLAGLPAERSDADPEESGAINETPTISIPIEVAEPSAVETPAPSAQDSAPAVKNPEQTKPQRETRRRAHRPRQSRVIAQPRPFNFFEILFGQQSAAISLQAGSQPYPYPIYNSPQASIQHYQYPAYSNQQAGYQQYQQPAYASQQTGYQQYQQPAYSYYQQPGQQQHQVQPGNANQQSSQSPRAAAPR